jgi:MFS family permease
MSTGPSGHSQWSLLRERRFLPFFLTQFSGAMNDNVFKISFTLLVTYFATQYTTLSTGVAVNLIAAAFILPFVLLSATSGQIADKFDKARIMQLVKVLEVAFMAVAAVGFLTKSFPLLLATTFLMGVHSTLFICRSI